MRSNERGLSNERGRLYLWSVTFAVAAFGAYWIWLFASYEIWPTAARPSLRPLSIAGAILFAVVPITMCLSLLRRSGPHTRRSVAFYDAVACLFAAGLAVVSRKHVLTLAVMFLVYGYAAAILLCSKDVRRFLERHPGGRVSRT